MSAIATPHSLYKSLMPTHSSEPLAEYYIPELYCTFTVYRLHPKMAEEVGSVCLYIYIDYDTTYDGVSFIPCMDLAYRTSSLEHLLDMGTLQENLIEHYLTGIVMERSLDEWYH